MTAINDRERMRRLVAQHAPLVELLRSLYPASMPSLNATDREIGAFLAEQRMVERLEKLLSECREAPTAGSLPKVLET